MARIPIYQPGASRVRSGGATVTGPPGTPAGAPPPSVPVSSGARVRRAASAGVGVAMTGRGTRQPERAVPSGAGMVGEAIEQLGRTIKQDVGGYYSAVFEQGRRAAVAKDTFQLERDMMEETNEWKRQYRGTDAGKIGDLIETSYDPGLELFLGDETNPRSIAEKTDAYNKLYAQRAQHMSDYVRGQLANAGTEVYNSAVAASSAWLLEQPVTAFDEMEKRAAEVVGQMADVTPMSEGERKRMADKLLGDFIHYRFKYEMTQHPSSGVFAYDAAREYINEHDLTMQQRQELEAIFQRSRQVVVKDNAIQSAIDTFTVRGLNQAVGRLLDPDDPYAKELGLDEYPGLKYEVIKELETAQSRHFALDRERRTQEIQADQEHIFGVARGAEGNEWNLEAAKKAYQTAILEQPWKRYHLSEFMDKLQRGPIDVQLNAQRAAREQILRNPTMTKEQFTAIWQPEMGSPQQYWNLLDETRTRAEQVGQITNHFNDALNQYLRMSGQNPEAGGLEAGLFTEFKNELMGALVDDQGKLIQAYDPRAKEIADTILRSGRYRNVSYTEIQRDRGVEQARQQVRTSTAAPIDFTRELPRMIDEANKVTPGKSFRIPVADGPRLQAAIQQFMEVNQVDASDPNVIGYAQWLLAPAHVGRVSGEIEMGKGSSLTSTERGRIYQLERDGRMASPEVRAEWFLINVDNVPEPTPEQIRAKVREWTE